MDKKTFFINAMKLQKFKKLAWVISAFSLTKQGSNVNVNVNAEVPYGVIVPYDMVSPYDIISDLTGYSYFDPDQNKVVKIEDGILGEPLFNAKDKIIIGPDDIPNLKETIETTYGRLLFNWLVLVTPFGTKIDYYNNLVNLGKVEDIILSKLVDDVEGENPKTSDLIYVSEYLEYTKCVFHLTGFSQVFSQGLTEKALSPPPGINEYKAKLLEENKDHLSDMATIADIDKKLIEFDAKFLEGDESEDFLISKKSKGTVRKKMFLMQGAEQGLDDNNVSAELVTNSLSQGWDINKFPAMNNTLRAGSFNRGAQTELGGTAVKMLLRASSNINLAMKDCGSTLGSPYLITDENKSKLVGFSIISKGKLIKIDMVEETEEYVGNLVLLRNPMYCKCTDTDYCETCVGDRLKVNPTGVSSAVAMYGDVMLGIFMKAMHGTSLELAKMNIDKSIN